VLGLVECSLLVFETGLVIFKVIGRFTLYLGVQVVWLLNIAAVKSKQIFYKPTVLCFRLPRGVCVFFASVLFLDM